MNYTDRRAAGARALLNLAKIGLLGGTALAAAPGFAQNITYNGPGPYALTQKTPVSGGPRAIDITVTSDNATVDTSATTVTSTNTGSSAGVGIGVNNTGPGNVLVNSGDVTANGSGQNTGIDVRANAGTITINNTGTIGASGNNSDRGIVARSGGGDVAINSNVASGQQYGIIVTGNGGTFGDTGTTTITSTNASANGTGLVNAIVGQGYRVVINSGTASNTNAAGVQGTAIFANASAGGVLINAGTTSALGQNQAALQVFSEGAVDVTSGTIHTTQNSDGLSIQSGTDVVVRSTSIVTDGSGGARGLVLGGNSGGGGFNGGPNGFAYNSATVTSGSITTAGNAAYAIYVTPNGTGSTTINSGDITTTGANASGIFFTPIGSGVIAGPVTINSTGLLQTSGGNATGIRYNGGTGALTINNSGAISATGAGSLGIGITGQSGTVAITSNKITTGGANGIDIAAGVGNTSIASTSIGGAGVGINAPGVVGTLTINSGTITLPTAAGSSTTNGGINAISSGAMSITSGTITGNSANPSYGINAQTSGGAALSIASGSVTASGDRTGIRAATDSGALIVNSTGTITTNAATGANGANTAVGLYATSNSGPIAITSANIATTGNYAVGIQAFEQTAGSTGTVSVTSTGTLSTTGNFANGIYVAPANGAATITNSGAITTAGSSASGILIAAQSGTGAATINNSGSVGTAGSGSYGVFANAGGPVTIASNAVTTSGQNAIGVFGISTVGANSITSTNVATSGQSATGINGQTTTGALAIHSGAVTTTGATAAGINAVTSGGAIAIASDNVATTGASSSGIVGSQSNGGTGAIAVTSGTVTTANGNGIDIRTPGAVTITSGNVVAGGASSTGIIGQSSGGADVTINADSTTGGRRAIFTAFTGGTTTINSNFATASGLSQPNAIIGQGATVIVNSKTATLTGNGSQGAAIFVQSGSGGATINSDLASTQGLGQVGIQLYSDKDGAINSGTVTTIGDFARGIYSNATGANVVKSASVTTSGNTATGIYVSPSPTAANQPASGSVTVVSGSVATSGDDAVGIFVSPITPTGSGNASILTGATSITSGTIATAGARATGISVGGTTGAITIASSDIATQGVAAGGIRAQSTVGAVNIQSGNVTTQGAGAQGIFAQTTDGAISINAGTTATAATGQNPADNGTSDAVFGLSTGAGSVTIVSQNASTNGDYANAVGAVGGGAVTITSGTASTSGIQVASVYGNSRNADTSITAANTTATGQNAYAVEGHARGNVTIASGTATAAHGDAIFASAGGNVAITAAVANAAGDGGAGVVASGGTGVTLNIGSASSTGTASSNGTTIFRADAIYARAINGAITANVGSASALGAGADGIRLIANGTGGAVTLNVTDTVSSAGGNGIFIDPPGAVAVTVASGASVSGASAGLNTTGGTNSIVNAGSITGTSGPGILASGATNLDNSGTIAGANGIAVQLGASDDSVTLRTGSSVTGTIAGGGGTDTATLIGTGTAATATQTVAAFDGFSKLNVASGYWTASSAPSSFGSVSVGQGSSLELRSVTGAPGLTITAPTIADAGTLVVRTANGAASSFGSTQLTGAGLFNVTGTGTLSVATDNSAFTGKTLVSGGTLQLTGTLGAVETAQGGTFVLGNGGTSGNVTGDVVDNGTFVANRSDNYTLAGGLSGNGTFVKQGSGSFTFGGAYTFTGSVDVVAGSLRFAKGLAANSEIDLSGGGKLDLSGQANTIAELAGSSPNATIDITGGTLTDNQATNTTFAGSLTGTGGAFIKTGAGNLNLTGASTYSGPTSVTGGTLSVNGSLASIVSVLNGGKLGGNGTVGGVNAGNGGIVGPGNSIGTLNVAGNVAFGPGSTYQVEANAAGQADRIVATGTATLTGGTVSVLAQPGTYARVTGYNILTATGGVTGTFSNVTSNLAFLSPQLTYSSNAVQLILARNDIAFSSFAGNANQARTANAVQALGFGNGLYNLVLTQSDAGTQTALASLATEIHAGVGTAIVEQERDVREIILDRSRSGGQGTGLWLHGLYDWAHSRGGSALRLGVDRKGVLGGIDGALGGLKVGAVGGYVEGDLQVRSQSASANDRTKLVGVYAGWAAGALSVRGGANWSWHDIDTRRAIVFPGLSGTSTASYEAQSGQLFGEIAYNLLTGPVRLEPFAGYAHVRSRTDGFAEAGSTGALNVGRDRRDADFATLGLRLGGALPMGPGATLRPRVSAAWQRGWGDLTGTTTASFGPSAGTFVLTGAGVGRDTLVLDGGFDAELGGGLSVGASANAGLSNRWSSTGLRATLGLRF